jgi:hypothetical protein
MFITGKTSGSLLRIYNKALFIEFFICCFFALLT